MTKKSVPADKRINRNKLYILLASDRAIEDLNRLRRKFGIPSDLLRRDLEAIESWTTWLCESSDRLNGWKDAIGSFMKKNMLGEQFRGAVEEIVKFGDQIIAAPSNIRVIQKPKEPDTVTVKLHGPVSKKNWNDTYLVVGRIMSKLSDSDWMEPITSKEDLGEAYRYYCKWKSLKTMIDADGNEVKPMFSQLVEVSSDATDEEFIRETLRIKRMIYRFQKEVKKAQRTE